MSIGWHELRDLMVLSPDVPVRGQIRSLDGADTSRGWFAYSHGEGQARPVPTAMGEVLAPYRVWRVGDRVRIQFPDGSPSVISDGVTCWRFWQDGQAPISSPASALVFTGSGTELLKRREQDTFLGDDFTYPTGPVTPTTFLGRDAWAVELAPPEHKPFPLQLVIDAETGLVLQQRNDGFQTVDEWVEFVTGEPFDDGLFVWTEASRDHRDLEAQHRQEHELDMQARRDWFTREVVATPLRVEVSLEVNLHRWDDDTGEFEASISSGIDASLARRRRRDDHWELRWSGDTVHRWTQGQWDWALMFHHRDLGKKPGLLASLKSQLGTD